MQSNNISEYTPHILEKLPKGILLNTKTDRFNTMVIGWGHIGTLWGKNTFAVYVRESRYTKKMLDESGEFSISIPLFDTDPEITKVCGSMSGRDIDKVKILGLTLCEGRTISTPCVKEYPVTIECRVLSSQMLDERSFPEDIFKKFYETSDGSPIDNHFLYIGEIVDFYRL